MMFEKISALINTVPVQPGVSEWLNKFREELQSACSVGNKFLVQVSTLMNEQPVVEDNKILQERLSAASIHFRKHTESFMNLLEMPDAEIEHIELAKKLNPLLTELYQYFHSLHHTLLYLDKSFILSDYLHYKFNYKLPLIKINLYAGTSDSQTKSGYNELLVRLRVWRNEICDRHNLPVYMVATQESLIQISKDMPATEKSLKEIKGFGNAKVKKYGKEILEIVRNYQEESESR